MTETTTRLTPQEFAKACREVERVREASWDDRSNRYKLSYTEAAEASDVPAPWAKIIAILLFPGYCDVWDWCDQVDPTGKGK